jgi:hypothetical protein
VGTRVDDPDGFAIDAYVYAFTAAIPNASVP